MQLGDKADDIRHMFDHMPANNLFKLVITERVRKDAEVVDHVGMAARIRIDADGAGEFILATAYVQNSLRGFGHAISFSATANS